MIVYKQEITEEGKNATSIRDFHYRDTEYEKEGSNGMLDLAGKYFRERKIIDRRLLLKDNGCTLEILTIFKDRKSFSEYMQEDLHKEAISFFENRNRLIKTESYEVIDETSLKSNAFRKLLTTFKSMTLEQILNKISQLQSGTNNE